MNHFIGFSKDVTVPSFHLLWPISISWNMHDNALLHSQHKYQIWPSKKRSLSTVVSLWMYISWVSCHFQDMWWCFLWNAMLLSRCYPSTLYFKDAKFTKFQNIRSCYKCILYAAWPKSVKSMSEILFFQPHDL